MSADSHTVCPKCHPWLLDYRNNNGVIDHAAEEFGIARDVRENIEYYIEANEHGLFLIFLYRADCWECSWHFEHKFSKKMDLGEQKTGTLVLYESVMTHMLADLDQIVTEHEMDSTQFPNHVWWNKLRHAVEGEDYKR